MKYIVKKPKEESKKPPVLIIMHGYGADEHDLLSIASELPQKFLVISLQAPIPLAWGGYSWYHLEQTATGLHGDNASRLESEDIVVKKLPDIIKKESGDLDNIFLLGFSQGAAMCYALVGKQNLEDVGIKVKGVVALSGYIPADVIPYLEKKDLSVIPFFLSHGEYDDLIAPEAMQQAQRVLLGCHASVTSKLYPVGHGMTEETITDIKDWFLIRKKQ